MAVPPKLPNTSIYVLKAQTFSFQSTVQWVLLVELRMLSGTGFAGKCAFLVLAQTENNFIYFCGMFFF